MAGLRSVAWLVALLLVASLLVNFRYVKYTSAVQDPCPRPAEPARAATPASAEVQPASKLPGVQAPMHRRRAPLPATTPQASTAEPAHSGAAGAVEDPSFIIVTFATKGVLDFALNWVLHIRALELPHMLGAMDDTMVTVCERWGVPVHAVHRGGAEASSSDALSGLQNAGMLNVRGSDKGFAGLGVLKTLFIQSLLRGGRDVLISDTDTAWFRDPRPLVYGREPPYHDFSKADLLISTDCIDSTDDESDGNSGCWYTPVQKNTGMMFFRANNRSLTFVKEWEDRLVQYYRCPEEVRGKHARCEGYNDQNLLNEMIDGRPLGSAVWHDGARNAESDKVRRSMCAAAFQSGRYGVPLSAAQGHTPGSKQVYMVCMPGKLERYVVGVLPTIYFANGHSFFVQQRFLSTGVWPTAVHVTFTWGDSASYAYGKLQRMKDFGMWKLPFLTRHASSSAAALPPPPGAGGEPSKLLYTRRFLLVTDDLALPHTVPFDRADYDQRAWQHVDWQLRVRAKLQHAIALAVALNRTLILPRFWCYCDRYFYRLEACMIPGGHHATQLPFVCPFDHIFDSSHWYEQPTHISSTHVGKVFQATGFEGHLYGDELRQAPQVSNSRAILRAARGAAAGAPAGASPPQARAGETSLVVEVPRGSSDAQVARLAANVSHAHIVQVSLEEASAIFGGFASTRDASDFHQLVMWLFGIRVAYCQKECRFEATMYPSVKKKERDPCVWLEGTAKLESLPGGLAASSPG